MFFGQEVGDRKIALASVIIEREDFGTGAELGLFATEQNIGDIAARRLNPAHVARR